ncbi:uncharacterized protein LOC114408319 [Glycine soja]|uniref:RWP-RK domain-containing protein n=1 Tax=Glycine soja TaxID=3848 RepID=A0A445KW14_GLYSO|nr:uncharacterized protein LOC114408319 [Glycine soja]KHN29688.1 Protein NLP6 [Glycine soja]RZC15167.1 hypothetical protein D0Y65_008859 [Glycine soja]
MDNNNNNNINSSVFVSYVCRDPFVSPLLDNFNEPDPALVYLLPEPNLRNDEQQPLQGHVSSTDSTIHDQSHHYCNDNFTIGGGVFPNYEFVEGSSKNKRKYPFTDTDIEDQSFMHDFEAGPSNLNQPASGNMGPRNWPPMPRPFFCTCCQVLRQTIHTNGTDFERLEIHGRIGLISHIIIQNQSITPGGRSCDNYQMIDFTNGSPAEVKGFLEDYIARKDKLGYIIAEESFSEFYEAVCTKLDWVGKRTNNEDDDLTPQNVEEEPEPEPEPPKERRRKRSRKDQSDRINSMTLDDLSGVFHITMKAAKNVLDMSVTAIKSICRKCRLYKWPHRQLQPLARRLKVLKRALESSQDPVVIQTTSMEVRRIKQHMTQLCGGVTPTGIEIPEVEE